MPRGWRKGIATADLNVDGRRIFAFEDELDMIVGIAQREGAVKLAEYSCGCGAKELHGLVEKMSPGIVEAAPAKLLQGLPVPTPRKFGFGDANLHNTPQETGVDDL